MEGASERRDSSRRCRRRCSWGATARRAIAAFEAGYVEWFVRRAGRNFSKAARSAGIDRTIVAPVTARNVRRPHVLQDETPDQPQHLVPHPMAVFIVDFLELIEIEQQQRCGH